MLSVCHDLDDVSDRVLAQLYSANEGSLRRLLDAIDPEIKPALAFFAIAALIFRPWVWPSLQSAMKANRFALAEKRGRPIHEVAGSVGFCAG